jgi:hypothetical protein
MQTSRAISSFKAIVLSAFLLAFANFSDAADIILDLPKPQIENLSFTIQDQRPEKQRKTGSEAFSTGNCAYSSMRVGDNLFDPSRIDLVADRLQQDFSEQLKGKVIVVNNFVIHRNFGKQARDVLRKPVPGLINRAIGSAMANAAPMSCAPDDLRGGYSPEETPNDVAPIIVVIDISIGGTKYHVRTVYEPIVRVAKEKPAVFVQRSLSAALKQSLDELARQVSSTISTISTASSETQLENPKKEGNYKTREDEMRELEEKIKSEEILYKSLSRTHKDQTSQHVESPKYKNNETNALSEERKLELRKEGERNLASIREAMERNSLTEQQTQLKSSYARDVKKTIRKNWNTKHVPQGYRCNIEFIQIPGGLVSSITFLDCPDNKKARKGSIRNSVSFR